jgi:phage recombination protein Bet
MMNGDTTAMVHAPVARADLSMRFTHEQRQIILDTCCGGASESEARALLAIAEARGVNPLLGECFFVKRWDAAAGREKWAVQASIDSLRIKAEQTGLYAGQDEPEYEHDDQKLVILARVRVWRKDWPRPAVGVARWAEYVQTKKGGEPTSFWQRMPYNQLAKCAEALALRKAFPAVLAKMYVAEEMAQADSEPGTSAALGPAADRRLESAPGPSTPDAAVDLDALARDFEDQIAAVVKGNGTKENLRAIGLLIAASALDKPRRAKLADIYDTALSAITTRNV